jgi:hypothetical protein
MKALCILHKSAYRWCFMSVSCRRLCGGWNATTRLRQKEERSVTPLGFGNPLFGKKLSSAMCFASNRLGRSALFCAITWMDLAIKTASAVIAAERSRS